ncbi:MAG: 3-isopropylmalate dehydratase small subunit [Candidatus Sumerlaeia bacterium]|nr:3-isopropylmalate dehydratase small subunit [Candidatus Sumerlaeia bacterium]
MESMKRQLIKGPGVPVRGNDIDTDRIIPARYLKCVTFDGLGVHAFEDDRLQLKERGKTHSFDEPKYKDATVLIVNKNFGCGSSREHAPQSIMRWGKGIKAVIGESFAEIFFGNCVALGVPALTADAEVVQALQAAVEENPGEHLEVNLDSLEVTFNGRRYPVKLPDGVRKAFLEGRWDTTSSLIAARENIEATAAGLPYFNHWE